MKGLTIRQPWCWAIAYGGKNVENRGQNFAYRGLLAIHAGLVDDEYGATDKRVRAAWQSFEPRHELHHGAIVAVADLVDVHRVQNACCRPWGEETHSGWPARHLVLADVHPLPEPVPCRGKQGLWTVPEDVVAAVNAQLAALIRAGA